MNREEWAKILKDCDDALKSGTFKTSKAYAEEHGLSYSAMTSARNCMKSPPKKIKKNQKNAVETSSMIKYVPASENGNGCSTPIMVTCDEAKIYCGTENLKAVLNTLKECK